MNVEPKRVKKVDSPLLIIGLGGTGSDALLTIMDKFSKRFVLPVTPAGERLDAPERTAYLAFDTDTVEMRSRKIGDTSFRQEHMFQLQIPNRLGVGTIPSYITQWWDNRLTGYEINNGAGGIRQVGRFVLFHNVDAIVTKLRTTIHNLIALPANQTMTTLEIVLTTGISGGTGSGSFLDMAYLIRYVLSQYFGNVRANFMAYILTPNVNVDKIASIDDGTRAMLEATGFAALKELDFWMNDEKHHYPFTQQYSDAVTVNWDQKPFDNVILMSDAKRDGTLIENAYNNCLDILSESVLNFYADEQVGTNGQISLRSHLSNITGRLNFLNTKYPANYCYMSVGAAVSNAQQDAMVTYEAAMTFDRVVQLQRVDKVAIPGSRHAMPLLGDREGEQFLMKFMPPSLDYFSTFASELQDPGVFDDPSYTLQTIHDSEPLHGSLYTDWQHTCTLQAKTFAVREVNLLKERFKDLVSSYVTNLQYGPFETSNFLKDASNNGFVDFLTRLVNTWQSYADTTLSDRNNDYNTVKDTLYGKMAEMSKVAIALNMWAPAQRYKDGCQRLFHSARDNALSMEMHAELKDMLDSVKAYCITILPAFCNLLIQMSVTLSDDAKKMTAANQANDMASMMQVQNYVKTAFGDPQQDALAQKVLDTLVKESQSIDLDNMGNIAGMAEIKAAFEQATQRFVQSAATTVNGQTMDHLLQIVLPGSTQQQQVDYLSQTLLPNLEKAAQTMLPLLGGKTQSDEYITYAYVSIPDNAPTIDQGVTSYQKEVLITPKRSDVTDRIYWLNTLNCVPMYLFADLFQLEKIYEDKKNDAKGLHLVYAAADGRHELRNDWSCLPSPVVHELQQLPKPKSVSERQKAIDDMLDQALENGAASIRQISGKDQLILTLRMDHGMIETMDQFDEKLKHISENANLSPEERIAALETLSAEGEQNIVEYKDFVQIFADAHSLPIEAVPPAPRAALDQAEANRRLAHKYAAQYILYAWKPQLAEQLIAQREMHQRLQTEIQKARDMISDITHMEEYVKAFMSLYLADFFTFGRTSITFTDTRGEEITLMNKGDFTDEELNVYSDFCKPLALMLVLANEKDPRIDVNDRRYLDAKAADMKQEIERMSDDKYNQLVANAKAFRTDFEKIPNAILYDRGTMPKPTRQRMSDLMTKMLTACKAYA